MVRWGSRGQPCSLLCRARVSLCWLSSTGQACLARLERPPGASAPLRVRQLLALRRCSIRLELAREVVQARIDSQLDAARHYQRQGCRPEPALLEQLQAMAAAVPGARNLAVLRGLEGQATALWFRLFAALLQPPWTFPGRSRRPPADPANSLLSLGSTLLTQRVTAALEGRGLEPALGVLHEYRAGRPSLACDLVEPLRVPAVERWVLALCNQGQVQPADFGPGKGGGVYLQRGRFGYVVADWERHWLVRGLQGLLDHWVERFVARLRGRGPTLPDGADRAPQAPGQAEEQPL